MSLLTFKGGVHPNDGKALAKDKAIVQVQPKGDLVYPMSQHIGAPAVPIVAKGDHVLRGQMIAEAGGFVSAPIYASVSGTVKVIEPRFTPAGSKVNSIVIENDGEYEEVEYSTPKAVSEMSKEEILNAIGDAGIVGMGGATFPTHVKLSPPPGMAATILIINAAECEPYLTSDHQLILEKGEEILIGTKILMKAIQVNKAVIGIENNKQDAIELLTRLTIKYPGIEVCPLKMKYPQGGEKQLIDAIIRRQVPSGNLPIATGTVVQNIGTAFAVYEAVQKNKPLFERIVTVTGKSLNSPSNFKVRIGTPIGQLIQAAGGMPEDTGKIISGGPMMGKAVTNTDIPVTKGCSGVLLIRKNEAIRKEMSNCIRCAKCVFVCPMGLEPNLLMNLASHALWDKAESNHIMDCIECGSCSYTCPAYRPLLDYIRLGKGKVGNIIRSRAVKK